MAQLHRLRWRIGGAGALLLLGGFVASHFIASRLAVPVEKLALDSEENRAQRKRAEAALASTSEKLKRSTRYSADASHQLKSPVTLLRAGLEGLLPREDFTREISWRTRGGTIGRGDSFALPRARREAKLSWQSATPAIPSPATRRNTFSSGSIIALPAQIFPATDLD